MYFSFRGLINVVYITKCAFRYLLNTICICHEFCILGVSSAVFGLKFNFEGFFKIAFSMKFVFEIY